MDQNSIDVVLAIPRASIRFVISKQRTTSYKFRKVRFKAASCLLLALGFSLFQIVSCNRPPRFLIDGYSEIVLRLKEGPDTPVGTLLYKLKGYDPDGDPLSFGVRETVDSNIIRVEKSGMNEANIYLNKELDREIKDEYSFILTLSDGRLGDFSVTQSLLLLVEDVNDNEPIFKPFTSAVEVFEDSQPGIIATIEATDRDEGAYGQVVYYLEELDGDNDMFTISTTYGKGVIRLAGTLDYERKSLYQLRVLAKDRANQQINSLTLTDVLIDCRLGSSNSIKFLIDSGADVNVIGGDDWTRLHRDFRSGVAKLKPIKFSTNNVLRAYGSASPVAVKCAFEAEITVVGLSKPSITAEFVVVNEGRRSLLGRSTASDLKLLEVGAAVNNCESTDKIVEFPKMPGVTVKFSLDKSVPPVKNAYFNVPAAYRESARMRLEDMEKQGIIERVTKAPNWISGMSAVAKGKNDFRLVVNMRAPNRAIKREYYRLPLIDDMKVKLYGSKYFTKLDLTNAFYHLELTKESRDLTTFLTENGMYRFTRLMFGVNCAPEIFQREMSRILEGVENVIVYIDDVLAFAETLERLRQTVTQVLQILRANNLTLNTEKCEFDKTRIKFLGHELDEQGFHVDEGKIKDIRKFRQPVTASELRSFLGLASFISSYIPNFAEIASPLWAVVSNNSWSWGPAQTHAFELLKDRIVSCTTSLGYFSDSDKTILYTDASPAALGAVLVQEGVDQPPRIISFASKALTPTEKKYAQNQREALGAVWAVEHFSYFLLGRHFVLRTDAQGVTFILNRSREDSKRALTRADGWALRLSPYSYDVEYVRGRDNIADSSSRLYDGVDAPFQEESSPWEIASLEANAVGFLTEAEIMEATARDQYLQQVIDSLESGEWAKHLRKFQGRINTGTAALLVKVKDIEDQPPEFLVVSSVARVDEDAPIGTIVTKVKAIDGDRGVNNRIRYSISTNVSTPFKIDENLGAILTTSKLNREDTRNLEHVTYILEIIAIEISKIKPAPSVRTEITIVITDVNDETPTFRSNSYEGEINENAQQNTPVSFLQFAKNEVFDYDQGKNGTFDLYLEPNNGAFEISPSRAVNEATFVLRVKDPNLLDFEKITSMNFTIHAREIAPEGKHSSATIVVHIRDQNDNFPEFSKKSYDCYLPENSGIGALLTQIQAIDIDSGDFGTSGIRFIHLSGSIADLLLLNPLNGVVTIKAPGGNALDRELVQKHYLTIEARDNLGRGNRNTVQLVVHILDVNDNPPIFLQNLYEARLMENKLAFETPLLLEARDADLNGTRNSEIKFEIIEGQFKDNFTVNAKTGKLAPKTPIDFELLNSGTFNIRPIQLTVLASDGGVPNLSSKISVVIHVQDVNDHAPQFYHTSYSQSVPENLPSGSPIIEVKAIDKDGSSPNNFIVYRIYSGASDKFVISPDTGVISVATGATLDPDMTDPKTTEYSLSVLALDGGIGEQQLQSYCNVNITITDVNNKLPYFLDPGTISIRENTPVGTYAYRLIANDLDKEPILRYYMDSNTSEARSEEGALVKISEYDYLSAFMLNSTDGLIRVVKLLDREKVEIIKLGFIVEDIAAEQGKQTATTTLTITVDDENDNNPKFKSSFYKRSIAENSPNGVTIMSVIAYDIDKNKTIRYNLEGPKEVTDLLHLDEETGEIMVANRIDFEVFNWLNFTVRATDAGHPARSTLAEVFIQVIDENDNNPYFSADVTNFTVYENSPIGTKIATIQAQDPDSGVFGKITYLIDRVSSSGKFSIDPDSGSIVVADYLDREIKDSYMLVIETWDNYQFGHLSGESRNSFKQIFVSVLDENDNSPIIQVPSGCVQVTEFHDIREPLMVLKATDADDPRTGNGLIGFDIIDVAGLNTFYLKQKEMGKAEIYSTRSLNNLYGNYSLLVMASDEGSPSKTVSEKIDICVLDFNDHAPEFISPSNNITIRIPENATIGTTIIQVMAIDSDIGPNAAVKYRFKPDPLGNYRSFSIDEDNGSILLKLPLDRERQKIHELRIEAYDQGIPSPLSADLDLTIYVRNINDYEPQFLVEEITVNFTEHTKPGVERKQLPDTIDRDEVDELDDPPSMVCYFIVHGNENGHFRLDPHSHILMVTKELDREDKSNHTLIVKATEDCINMPPNISLNRPEAVSLTAAFSSHQRITKPTVANQYDHIYERYKKSRSLDSWHDEEIVGTREDMTSSILSPHFEKYTGEIFYHNDNTLVRVLVYVQDINDNPPVFIQKVFTGGVTTSTVFGTQFMKLTAIDRDEGIHGQVSYYQIGEIKRTLTEGLDNLQKPPFLVDQATGAVQLNFDPQKGMKGYFDFKVTANDSAGHQDEAHVFIYLLREDQRVKFVLRLQPPEVREKIYTFRDVLSNVSNCIVNVDDFRTHENRDGSVDKTKTDLYLHLVNRRDNSILEVSEVLKLVDQNIEKLDELFKEFNVLDTQASEASFFTAELSGGPMMIWLFVSNMFIGALLIVVLALCASQRSSYRRQLRAARVANYAAAHSDLTVRGGMNSVPNTNKHSVEGSNPIWMKAYENEWFKNDEDLVKNISGPESIDDNVINADEFLTKMSKTDRYDIVKQYNLYSQIDKLTNGNILTKKLETTEL